MSENGWKSIKYKNLECYFFQKLEKFYAHRLQYEAVKQNIPKFDRKLLLYSMTAKGVSIIPKWPKVSAVCFQTHDRPFDNREQACRQRGGSSCRCHRGEKHPLYSKMCRRSYKKAENKKKNQEEFALGREKIYVNPFLWYWNSQTTV